MKKIILLAALALGMQPAYSFCGFYVAKADAKLFNTTTQVIVVRNGEQSTITMSSDFKGDVRDFAMVVPVPKILQREDIRVVERVLFDKLDAYSGPRLVEYFDQNPCYTEMLDAAYLSRVPQAASSVAERESNKNEDEIKSVRIEAKYTVGEYDILILSAEESGGLERWLLKNGYKIPEGARDVLEPYIKSNMKFFVVKVNLEELDKTGSQLLRPLQVSFDSPKFMLPIRLGMANAHGLQDMIVYLLTQNGRVETVNYRTVKIPTDRNIPEFIQNDFGNFYVDVYKMARRREGKNNVFLEYAWNISGNSGVKCDPCPSTPPIFSDLREAGVNWLSNNGWNNYAGNVFFTRLHVSYDRENFPQDLVFQETPNRENFQARYIITHAAPGPFNCPEAKNYLAGLKQRRTRELQELASLTGRNINSHSDYLNRIQGYLPEEKIKEPERRIELQPEKIHPSAKPNTAAVIDTVASEQTQVAAGKIPSDSGSIDQARFIEDDIEAAPVREATTGNSYLYLAASILLSTILVLMRTRKRA